MTIDTYRHIILLARLRDRARVTVAAHRRAGNRAVADIYVKIEDWLEVQMAQALAAGRW